MVATKYPHDFYPAKLSESGTDRVVGIKTKRVTRAIGATAAGIDKTAVELGAAQRTKKSSKVAAATAAVAVTASAMALGLSLNRGGERHTASQDSRVPVAATGPHALADGSGGQELRNTN